MPKYFLNNFQTTLKKVKIWPKNTPPWYAIKTTPRHKNHPPQKKPFLGAFYYKNRSAGKSKRVSQHKEQCRPTGCPPPRYGSRASRALHRYGSRASALSIWWLLPQFLKNLKKLPFFYSKRASSPAKTEVLHEKLKTVLPMRILKGDFEKKSRPPTSPTF